MDAKPRFQRGLECAGHVAGGDQLDPRADIANLRDHVLVSVAIQHHHRELLHRKALCFRDPAQVPLDRHLKVDHSARPPSDDQLLHVVDVGREH